MSSIKNSITRMRGKVVQNKDRGRTKSGELGYTLKELRSYKALSELGPKKRPALRSAKRTAKQIAALKKAQAASAKARRKTKNK
jgi:hypothetical protein